MASQHYDVVIVGAGPSGLGAARTAARLGFRTLVVERLSGAGDLSHPCGAIVARLDGLVSIERVPSGLLFPELDLFIPSALVTGYLSQRSLVSPSGNSIAIPFSRWPGEQAAVIDKPALLMEMAQAAEIAGAELRWGVAATGLLYRGRRVSGVRTLDGLVTAGIILAAEGSVRQLSLEGGLYAGPPPALRYAHVASMDMIAPAVGAEHVGQVITLGRRHTSAPDAFGTVTAPAPGIASACFTLFAAGPASTDHAVWSYLDEYIHHDPRVSSLFAGATVVGGASHSLVLRDGPGRIVSDGLMILGDAVAAGGHLGILPSIYLGRQAALTAADALDAGDVSASRLSEYEQALEAPAFAGLEAERQKVAALVAMPDDELDQMCSSLGATAIPAQRPNAWQALASVVSGTSVSRGEDGVPQRMYWPDTAARAAKMGAGAGRGR